VAGAHRRAAPLPVPRANGCNSRFLILDFSGIPGVDVWQVGNEGGFLASPVHITGDHANRVLLGPAERGDLIVDFRGVPTGRHVLGNVGPDEPFGGGVPGVDFEASDPGTTGQVMAFDVVERVVDDATTPPRFLGLPAIAATPPATVVRPLALIEKMSEFHDGPAHALLGTVDGAGAWEAAAWGDQVTENPEVGTTEIWEFVNTTEDAHPMHVHEVAFEVIERRAVDIDEESGTVETDPASVPRGPEPWETGFKDTVIAYPGEATRVKATFTRPGQYVWHCHIVEHEDNEMMRPYRIGPMQDGQPHEHA
jgi:spore coat protein A